MDTDYLNSNIDKAYKDAHNDYEKRKARIIENLNTLAGNLIDTVPDNYIYWIETAIKFIKEREI